MSFDRDLGGHSIRTAGNEHIKKPNASGAPIVNLLIRGMGCLEVRNGIMLLTQGLRLILEVGDGPEDGRYSHMTAAALNNKPFTHPADPRLALGTTLRTAGEQLLGAGVLCQDLLQDIRHFLHVLAVQ